MFFLTVFCSNILALYSQNIYSLKKLLVNVNSANDKIKIYQELANAYNNEGKGNEALNFYYSILKISSDPKLRSETHNEIGNINADMGNNEKAISSYQQALKFNSDKNLSLAAKINKNIGAVYLSWKKLDNALNYYLIAEELALKGKDDRTLADLSNNKGTVYEQKNQFDKANFNYQKALKFYLREGINDRVCLTYNNLAILSKVQNRFSEAANYYKKSVEYAAKANNKWLTAALGNNYGNLLSEMGNYSESEKSLSDALKLEKEISAGELIPETYENLAENEKRRGNYKQAYSYQKLFNEEKNKFINLENTKEVAKLQEQFEAVKKQKQIELLNKESKIQQLTLTKRNNTIFIIAGISVSVILIGLLFFSRYNIKQESRLKLASVEAKNQIQEEKLRISQELHDNIGSQLTFISNSIESFEAENGAALKLDEAKNITKNTIRELRRSVWLINQPEFSLDEFVIKLRDYVKPMETGKPLIQINSNNQDVVLQPIVATNLFRVIQEAINNALKYAQANLVPVDFNRDNNQLNINIKDDGNGFETTNLSEGYGLKNMKARVNTLKGEYHISSIPNEGTQINIILNI